MRMVRTAARALAGLAFAPALVLAQSDSTGGNFTNAWYWGINGGAMLFNAGIAEEMSVTAPTIGAEWLITRTRFGLRLSIQQAFFDEQTAVFDPSAPGSARPVDVEDWRRYSVEFLAFPKAFGSLRPYGGVGFALNVLQGVAPQGSFDSDESMEEVFLVVDEFSTRAALILTAGLQAGFGRSALFVQASAMPTRTNWLLPRSQYTAVLEAGIRHSFGSAIEKFF